MSLTARLLRRVNSTMTTISIRAIKPIVEDSANYDLQNLKFEFKIMSLKELRKDQYSQSDQNLVDLRFIEYESNDDHHRLYARMTVFFSRGKEQYKMELFGSVSAIYTDERMIPKMQEYLYWYMTKSLEENHAFMEFKEIRFPDSLSELYRKYPGWRTVNIMDFSWIDRDSTPTISKIMHGLIDNRTFAEDEADSDDDGSDMTVDVNFDSTKKLQLSSAYGEVKAN